MSRWKKKNGKQQQLSKNKNTNRQQHVLIFFTQTDSIIMSMSFDCMKNGKKGQQKIKNLMPRRKPINRCRLATN